MTKMRVAVIKLNCAIDDRDFLLVEDLPASEEDNVPRHFLISVVLEDGSAAVHLDESKATALLAFLKDRLQQ
jgi:signal transduction protein with GAF and PtsI domain